MTDQEQNQDQEQQVDQKQVEREQREQERLDREGRFRVLATDSWKVGEEQFRRLARTGEYTPEETPEAKAE